MDPSASLRARACRGLRLRLFKPALRASLESLDSARDAELVEAPGAKHSVETCNQSHSLFAGAYSRILRIRELCRLGAPKGIGALYFGGNLRLMPLIHGGIQEMGRRAGTENVPGIVGLGKAAELAAKELPDRVNYVRELRDLLDSGILERIEQVTPTGHPDHRLPGHASYCVEAIEGEALLLMLNQEGIYVNTGSACASKALKTSPVLVAIGLRPDLAQGSIVFTLNQSNTNEEIQYVLKKFPQVVEKLRSFSPIWKKTSVA